MRTKTQQLNLTLRPDTIDRLNIYCAECGRSKADVVTELIDRLVLKDEFRVPTPELSPKHDPQVSPLNPLSDYDIYTGFF